MLRNSAGVWEVRNKLNLSRLTATVIQKNSVTKNILSRRGRIKIFDPTPIFNATGPVPFPAVIVGVGSGIVDITESEE